MATSRGVELRQQRCQMCDQFQRARRSSTSSLFGPSELLQRGSSEGRQDAIRAVACFVTPSGRVSFLMAL